MENKPFIIGLYGCSCHPFISYDESDLYHKRKFEIDAPVKNRCSGLKGSIYSKVEKNGFWIVKYGDRPCDRHLEHSANLEPLKH